MNRRDWFRQACDLHCCAPSHSFAEQIGCEDFNNARHSRIPPTDLAPGLPTVARRAGTASIRAPVTAMSILNFRRWIRSTACAKADQSAPNSAQGCSRSAARYSSPFG
jgi:hypothetical protein